MFNTETPVAEIVLEHSECAPIFQRHRIDYCCKGQMPLSAACSSRGADLRTVMEDLKLAIAGRHGPAGIDPRRVPTEALLGHITDTHHKFLREALPFLVTLATKVARVHGGRDVNLREVQEVTQALNDALLPHLDHEEQVIFPAMVAEGAASLLVQRETREMLEEHLKVGALLERLRSAAVDFRIPSEACARRRTFCGTCT